MKRLAVIPAICLEWASVALNLASALAIAGADYLYDFSATKRDLDQIHENRS